MTAKIIRADVETRSPVDLPKCGAYVYFEHQHTRVLMCAYQIDDGPLQLWVMGQPCPEDFRQAVADGAQVYAYNAQFEKLAFRLLHEREDWPLIPDDRYVDTAAAAAAMSLPRALGDMAAALALPVQKDKEGTRLINKFSKPRRPRKGEDPSGIYWNEPEDHPEDWAKFCEYCRQDVRTEAAAAARLVPLSAYEQEVWLLNEKINQRGVRIDTRSAYHAIRLAEKAKKELDREMRDATDGAVKACSQVGVLVEWVKSQGVELKSMVKAEVTDLLEADDLPDNVRRALELRQEAAKTSVSKLGAMLRFANRDGRVRGGSVYHAAGTGRFQNKGVNMSNMPRPRKAFENGGDRPDVGPRRDVLFRAFHTEEPKILPLLYGDELGRPLHLISDAIRSFIWAAPGHEFIQADYSSIEGIVLAWLADEQWKLKELREIMADPKLPDMYRRTAARLMGLTTDIITKKHPLRQSLGKVSELALGFQGSVAAYYSMARNYGVKLEELYEPVWSAASEERQEKALRRYEGQLKRKLSKTDVLSKEAWLAAYVATLAWRESNSAIAASWRDSETAAREAVANPGSITEAARLKFRVARGFLWMQLPSGRCLAYGGPRLKDQVWARVRLDGGDWADAEVMDRERAEEMERKGEARIDGETGQKVTALGVNSVTKKWERFALYGGLIMENGTQAAARDLLVNGMFKAEAAGYPVVMTVYDEILTEVPRGFGDVKEFERIICELPPWAAEIPLQADGWRAKRYRK